MPYLVISFILGMAATLPAVLYVHGGGFVGGTVELFDAFCEDLVLACDVVVASVDPSLGSRGQG